MNKILMIATLLLCFVSNQLFGQSVFQNTKYRTSGIYFGFGYVHESILSNTYSVNKAEGVITPRGGFKAELSVVFFPFMVDMTYGSHAFKVKDYANWYYEDGTNVDHNAWELGISSFLFHFSDRFLPYAGILYRYSSLRVGDSEEDDEIYIASLNTSGPAWKVGGRLKLMLGFSLQAEYKQAMLLLKDQKDFNQWSLSVLINMNQYMSMQ